MFQKLLILLLLKNILVLGFENMGQKSSSSDKAYFEVLIDRVEQTFNDNDYIIFKDMKVRKVNKTRAIIGEIIFKAPVGNDIIVSASAYVKQGNEYRLMPYRISPTPFCDLCSNDEYGYPDLAKDSDFPADMAANCPLKAGTYKLNGVVFKLDNVPKSAAQSGDYAGEVSYNKDGKMIAQIRVYVTIHNI